MALLRAGTASFTTGTSSATKAVTIPSGTLVGDEIGIYCAVGNGSVTWSCPTFTAATPASGTTGSCQVLTHVYTGTEGWTPGTTTVTVTASGSHPWSGAIFAVPGSFDPAPVAGRVNGAVGTITVSGVTTSHAGDVLIWCGFCDGVGAGAGTPGTITPPGGYTAETTQANSTGSGSVTNVGVMLASKTQTAAGATGAQNGSNSGSFINGGLLIAVASSGATLADAALTATATLSASMTGGASVVPYLAGSVANPALGTATVVPITRLAGVGGGDAIVIAADITLSAAPVVSGVTDSQGNAYALAKTGPGTFAWICPNATALSGNAAGTLDFVTITWSTAGVWPKSAMVIGCPGVAGLLPLDAASTENDGTGTPATVASGVPAANGELALFILGSGNSGGVPSALTGMTSLGTINQASNQYLTVAYATAGAGAFSATATLTGTPAWTGLLLLLGTASGGGGGGGGGGPAGTAGLVGSEVDAGLYGTGDSALVTQSKFAALTGRPLTVTRIYFGPGNIPASLNAAGLAGYVGLRKVLLSLKPNFTTLSSSDLQKVDTFLASCLAGGLVADVSMFHEPAAEGLTAAQYIAGTRFYGPTVRKYYPLMYGQSAYRTHVDATTNARYYPGDAWVDKLVYDFYESDFRNYGVTIDSMASIADSASPPKPFGLWEIGVQVAGPPGAGPANPTHAQGTAYFSYIKNYMFERLKAGKTNADVAYFSGVNVAQGWDFTLSSSGPGAYLIPLYQDLFDTLTVAPPGGAQTSSADTFLQVTATMSASVTGGSPAPAPPPPPAPQPVVPVVIDTAAQWTFAVGPRQPEGGLSLVLTDAIGKSVTFRVAADQYHEASFSIRGTSPQASSVQELVTDLQVIRNGQTLAALRIVPTQDTLDATGHVVSVTALDYREVLRRRLLFPDDTQDFGPADQALIAWQMIQATQARPGGDLGIVRGLGQVTGTTRSFEAQLGDFVGDDITSIGLMTGGYDWDITPYGVADLRLDIWSPQRGSDRGVILEFGGGLVASITRSVDPTTFANSWLVTGQVPAPSGSGGDVGPIPATNFWDDAAGIATDPAGRWDQVDGTQLTTQDLLRARLAYRLADSQSVIPAYSIALQPGAWGGPGHIWLGDLVTIRIMSGRLAVNDKLRVMEIDVTIGDDGDEQVTLSVGRIHTKITRTIPAMLRRLRAIETL